MPVPPPPPPASELRKGSAIASLVLGCLGFVTFGVLGIFGAILGIASLRRAAKSPRVYGGGGLALAGAILGALSIPWTALVLGYIAGPFRVHSAERARLVVQEAGAIEEIQALHAAEARYFVLFGRYAGHLEELGPSPTGTAGPDGAELIPAELARGVRAGYRFTLTQTAEGYTINADPLEYRHTGRCSFFSDQTRTVRVNWGPEPASGGSRVVPWASRAL